MGYFYYLPLHLCLQAGYYVSAHSDFFQCLLVLSLVCLFCCFSFVYFQLVTITQDIIYIYMVTIQVYTHIFTTFSPDFTGRYWLTSEEKFSRFPSFCGFRQLASQLVLSPRVANCSNNFLTAGILQIFYCNDQCSVAGYCIYSSWKETKVSLPSIC